MCWQPNDDNHNWLSLKIVFLFLGIFNYESQIFPTLENETLYSLGTKKKKKRKKYFSSQMKLKIKSLIITFNSLKREFETKKNFRFKQEKKTFQFFNSCCWFIRLLVPLLFHFNGNEFFLNFCFSFWIHTSIMIFNKPKSQKTIQMDHPQIYPLMTAMMDHHHTDNYHLIFNWHLVCLFCVYWLRPNSKKF